MVGVSMLIMGMSAYSVLYLYGDGISWGRARGRWGARVDVGGARVDVGGVRGRGGADVQGCRWWVCRC